MLPHTIHVTIFSLVLLVTPSRIASATYPGYVETPWTPTTCLQESHFLTDPCTGFLALLNESASLDLDPFACTYGIVNGPDVGITCEVIQPSSVVPASPACPNQFSLWLTEDTPTGVSWYRVPCGTTYDVIRGNLSAVTPGVSQIDLGPVSCLADNVAQTNVWFITGPTHAAAPPVGGVFFYLVRSRSTAVPETYGYSTDSRERIPLSGDCSF